MKENLFFRLALSGVLVLVFIVLVSSCNSDRPANFVEDKTTGVLYDTTKVKVLFNDDGYVLIGKASPNASDTVDKNSPEVDDETAARMVRHFMDTRQATSGTINYPTVIDFNFKTVATILRQLDRINPTQDEKKSVRIYLSSYDEKALTDLYPGHSDEQRARMLNYVTAILVGRYIDGEVTSAYNLGNICPPNCPDPPGDGTPPGGEGSRVYRDAIKLPPPPPTNK